MKIIHVLILFFPAVSLLAQPELPPLKFEHIDEKKGLVNNRVSCILADDRGFMWFGTGDGLDRFDGSSFVAYRHASTDSTSLPGNDINDLFEDTQNRFWVSAHCLGLAQFNLYNGKSRNYYAGGAPGALKSTCDLNMAEDTKGEVWVCDRTALSVLNSDAKTFQHFRPFGPQEHSLIYHMGLFGNTIWLGHLKGLRSFDIASRKFSSEDSLVHYCTCGRIRAVSARLVLICTWENGLFLYDPENKKMIQLFRGLTTNDAAIVSLAGQQQLWVATTNGLYVADLTSGIFALTEKDFHHYVHDPSDPASLSSNSINCIYYDTLKNNSVWLGTEGGVDKLNPLYLQFHTRILTKFGRPFPTTTLYSILPEKNEAGATHYWLSYWHGSGLIETDSAFRVLSQLSIKDSSGEPAIVARVIRGTDGFLWIASWDGLWCYDAIHHRPIRIFRENGPGKMHLTSNRLDYVMEDKQGRFWLGTYGQGVDLLDFKDSTVTSFRADGNPGSLINNRCDFIYQDSRGRIWLAGKGLQLYQETTRNFKNYLPENSNPSSLPGSVSAILEDTRHRLWISSGGGLSLYNEKQDNFQNFSISDGLTSDQCGAITEDDAANLWITTPGGLSSINTNNYQISSYTVKDGLPTNQLGNVIFPANKGRITFSLDISNSPFVSFNPESLLHKRSRIPFHFTSISILGSELPLEKPVEDIPVLQLSYKQNVFTISFKALDYNNEENVRYAYQLVGFDKTWIPLEHRDNVTFTNLDGGNYELNVRATDASGSWMNHTLQLKIFIQPPFWKTWWFYLGCILLVGLAVYFIFIQRIRFIRKEEEKKRSMDHEIADLKMKALKAQMNPHFVFNSLSSIQESILNGNTEAAVKYLGKFSRLIRMVLQFSDRPLISLEEEISYLQLYLELESFRFENFSFWIRQTEPVDADFVRIPPMLVQPFVENALKHGLSHKDGEKSVSIIFEEIKEGLLKVTIEDNGIGRSAAAAINAGREFPHPSLGMKITGTRLDLMDVHRHPGYQVEDRIAEDGSPAGTRVILFIPIELQL